MPAENHLLMRMNQIGAICISWAYLENVIAVCFWSLTDLEEDYAKILTDDIDLKRRFELLAKFAPRKLPSHKVNELIELTDRISAIAAERNLAVHGHWEMSTGSPPDFYAIMTRGKYRHIPQDMTIDRMSGIRIEIDCISEEIEEIFVEANLISRE